MELGLGVVVVCVCLLFVFFFFLIFFFFNDTATTEIYTLSLHDALPIYFPNICGLLLIFFVLMFLVEILTAPIVGSSLSVNL